MSAGNFEHGVNAAVNKLSQVLGDAAAEPRYIETLPGYINAEAINYACNSNV